MLKRTISGAFYVAILVGFFCLREFVDYRIFHLLTWFFMIVGTFELARALKPNLIKGAYICAIGFAVIFVPVYCIGEYVLFKGWGWMLAIDLIAVMLITTSIIAIVKATESKSFLATVLLYIYPAIFILTFLLANDLYEYGFIALLMAFVVSPCSDTFAYLTGSLIGGKKLCPKISPKKTWSGAIGGTIGGVISGIIVYFIFTPKVDFFSPVLLFILIGFFASIFTLLGDLFESYIKRKVGIKDMGNIMPGHGGVLDRIDGTLFATALIYLIFLLV